MRSSPENQREHLQEDVKRTKEALSVLEHEKLLTGMLLHESKEKLSYSQDFLDGRYKLTFLIQGDPQTGKTTFLNVLLDDAIIPSSGHNAIIMVQYDETREIPALFTARLNEIFNSDRQIFVLKPGTLRDTGIRGRADIYSTLKEASKIVNPMSESMTLSSFRSGQTVFVIKYRISWLKELIGDDFILNRIQFMDIDMPPENEPNPENLLRLERIISSADHANIFVADCMNLFTIDIAAKYKELHENKEKSLLIMNRTDQLGVKEHIQKIKKNKTIDRLCSKLKIDFQTIETRVQKSQVTEEMRCEIFLQSFYESFYEDADIGQDSLTDGDVIYFVSTLFAFNRILLCKYKECGHDEEKAAFCSLFNQRNKNNPVYQNNRRNAALKKLDILQYYLQEEPAMYQSNFEPVKKAISNIAKTKFANLENELIQKIEEVRLRISDCRSYLTDSLSEQQIGELKTLRGQIKNMIEERSRTFTELANNFKGKIINLFEGFLNRIKDINTDYYVVKANNAKELTNMTHQFDEEINETAARFRRDYCNMETRYNEEINKLGLAYTDKQYMSCYITNNVRSEYKALERENESLVNVIEGLAIWAANIIITFIADGKEIGKITNLLRMFAKFFRNANVSGSFDLRVKNSKSTFEETTRSLISSHCEEEKKKRDKFEENFRDYLSNTNSGNIERAQLIIQESFGVI